MAESDTPASTASFFNGVILENSPVFQYEPIATRHGEYLAGIASGAKLPIHQ
jgi:hypothetical protein